MTESTSRPPAFGSFVVSQLGGRRAYQVPQAFHEAGRLAALFTDAVGVGPAKVGRVVPERFRPKLLRRLLNRVPPGIPPGRIRSAPVLGLRYTLALRAARTATDTVRAMVAAADRFDRFVAGADWGGAGGVYLFDGVGPRTVGRARADGAFVVVEQTIAPGEIQTALTREEAAAFPGWERAAELPDDLVAKCHTTQHETWAGADLIVCGSQFVADGIATVGGPADRVEVVPYGTDATTAPAVRPAHGGPLRVVTVGTVGLRKGSPYVLAAARRMGRVAQFRLVGPTGGVSAAALRDLATAVEVVGAVPPPDVDRHLAWADAYLLPSMCEGSAESVFEAMAAGLPVITTPNTGSVVRDGVDGFVVPIRDVDAIADRLGRLAADPGLRGRMAAAARTAAADYTVAEYCRRLTGAVGRWYAAAGRAD